jgi:hypothetical protein
MDLENLQDFEWDENKRQKNLEKHGIDFADVDILFERPVYVNKSKDKGEERWLVTGELGKECVTVICTVRGKNCRIISARRARHEESKTYRALHKK